MDAESSFFIVPLQFGFILVEKQKGITEMMPQLLLF
jgi:hypothetical protein